MKSTLPHNNLASNSDKAYVFIGGAALVILVLSAVAAFVLPTIPFRTPTPTKNPALVLPVNTQETVKATNTATITVTSTPTNTVTPLATSSYTPKPNTATPTIKLPAQATFQLTAALTRTPVPTRVTTTPTK